MVIEYNRNLYSRQVYALCDRLKTFDRYTLGEEAMRRLRAGRILISGVDGVGVEIAKNLTLAGVKELTLHDTHDTKWIDLATNFCLDENDLGTNRAFASRLKISELNDDVLVQYSHADLILERSRAYDVLVLCGYDQHQQLEIASICRANNIKLVIAENLGVFGRIFVDFGPSFVVCDPSGEPCEKAIVTQIDADTGFVTTSESHSFNVEDHIQFDKEPVEEIIVRSVGEYGASFAVDKDIAQQLQNCVGSTVSQRKQEETISFKPLLEATWDNSLVHGPAGSSYNPQELHHLWQTLSSFQEINKKSPTLDDIEDFSELHSKFGYQNPSLTEQFLGNLQGSFSPTCSIIGGMVAQEVIKALSQRTIPIRQFFYLCEPLTSVDKSEVQGISYRPRSCRYDGQAILWGWERQQYLANLTVFVVGAGAIGCEHLKHLAKLGVGTGPKGEVIITDMDGIELSNLNRQFLFRRLDIGKNKAVVAASMAKLLNPAMRIRAESLPVGKESEETFDDEFWLRLDLVLAALDNVDARRYIDSRCVYYGVPLIDSGTVGSRGQTLIAFPQRTNSCAKYFTANSTKKTYPMCTLKHFPYVLEHVVQVHIVEFFEIFQWSRKLFDDYFTSSIRKANMFLADDNLFFDGLESVSLGEQLNSLKMVDSLVGDGKPSVVDCIIWARQQFQNLFHDAILQILSYYPKDSVAPSGEKFWSAPKRFPTALNYNPDDSVHNDFLYSASILRAHVYNVNFDLDRDNVIAIAQQINDELDQCFDNVADGAIPANDEQALHLEAENSECLMTTMTVIKARLANLVNEKHANLREVVFEKDNDDNHHMEFIRAAANLRARNYGIDECDVMEARRIAGSIIPAMATTTSVVSGLACTELVKIAFGTPTTDSLVNCFFNLAAMKFSFTEPEEATLTEYLGGSFDVWDSIVLTMPKTLQQCLDEIQETTKTRVLSMSSPAGKLLFLALAPPSPAHLSME